MNIKLPFNLDSITQNVSKLTLKGGLAGKICHVLIYVALSMAAISWSVKLPYVAYISLGMIFVLTITVLWRLINLADKNPQSALMEGAEFLLHEQLMIGTKQQPQIIESENEIVVSGPIVLSEAERQQLEKPDEQPKRLSNDSTSGKEAR